MSRNFIYYLVILLILPACNEDESPETVNIRLKNTSKYDYTNIVVYDTKFQDLNSGNTSEYHQFDIAYRYAFVELEINGNVYTIQPIDYVGETPLKNGFYTYNIGANDTNDQYGRLSIDLVKD
ncbi:hypothetical protein OO013_05265 [Mangrovivirga sp. M17]|uniref:DUF4377 domain-containing protein n=1 Tax=Mangrovivirga halotolerans TaxID=2993936 RepID=A0ABT3RNU4_9BACT|nr:hypothetical protein [Mangrovivirga halotolerans]MCX2743262.1 hypothetical protein [Mangrovivirga halotolerans]